MDSLTTTSGHKCQRRDDDRGCWNKFLNWWILPVHLTLAAAFTFIVLKVLQGQHFLVSGSENPDYTSSTVRIYQSDVTTLLSLALILVRTLAGCWLTLTGWRTTFISLEWSGATLRETDRMINYRIPPFKPWARIRRNKESSRVLAATLWMIFLLALPAQFVAPLLTGAINWIPGIDYVKSPSQVSITTPGPAAFQWANHNEYQNNRFYEVLSASGLASIASPTSFNTSTGSAYRAPSRRLIPSLFGVALNSTLANVTVPYFQIHSLTWITSADQVKNDIEHLEQVISAREAPALNYSSELSDNPFSFGTDKGRLVLVNDVPWVPAPYDEDTGEWIYPPPTIKTAVQWVIVAMQFGETCASGWSPAFGPTPGLYMYSSPNVGNCYVFARMNYTAGAMACKECRVILDGVVEAVNTTNDPSSSAPIPDPLVENAVSMIPEVLFFMKVSNSSQAPSWQNIDGYTRGMISVAYQASWNSLANAWQTSPMAVTEISTPYSILVAQVTTWRVLTWFGLNAFLTISGLLLAVLQRKCQHKTIRNPALAALMLDTNALLSQDTTGLCNAVTLRKRDGPLRLRLKPSNGSMFYRHARLDVDTDAAARLCLNPLSEYSSRERLRKSGASSLERERSPYSSENVHLWEGE